MTGHAQDDRPALVHSGMVRAPAVWDVANGQGARAGVYNLAITRDGPEPELVAFRDPPPGVVADDVRVLRGPGIVQPHGTAVSNDGRWIYVSNNNLNQPAGAHAMHGSPATPAQPLGPGTIVVIDGRTMKVAKVIEVGHNATGIAVRTTR